jgi:hypothetical protein
MHIIYKSILYFHNVTRFYTAQVNLTVLTTPSPVRKVWLSVRRFSRATEWHTGVVGTLFWLLCRWGEKRRKQGQNLLCAWSALRLSGDWPLLSDCTWSVSYTELYRIDILIYLLTAIGLTPGGSSTVHIYTQTVDRTTQLTTLVGRLSGIRIQSGQTKINDKLTA